MYEEDRLMFLHDFSAMIKIFREIDSEYGDADSSYEANLKLFKTYVASFNKKYPNLHAEIETSTMDINLRIFLPKIKDKAQLKEFFPVSEGQMELTSQDKLFLESGSRHGLEMIFTPQEVIAESSREFQTLLAIALQDGSPQEIDLQKIFSKVLFKTKSNYSQKTFSA